MKSLFALLTFSLFCLSIFSQQSYGVSFENSLETSGGGWSSSSSNGIFWTTSAVVAPTITGIDPIAQNDDHFAYSETNGTFSGSQAISYLESPCFDLAMDTVNRVRFFYQLLGTVSDFNLEVSYDGGETYNETVSSISTMEQTNWTVQDIMGLNISNGSDAVRFRFAVTFDAGGSSIVAIDPFQLFGIPQSSPTDCPDLDCVENLTLNNTTLSEKFYRAKNQLTSNASIAANNHVTFTAGNQIILREGFIASNTNFTARIEDCNSTGVFQLVEDYTRSNLPFASEIDYFDAFGNGYTQNEFSFQDNPLNIAQSFQTNRPHR
ncbi:MAG: 3-coathanger stack domain-containing protein [Bacteroidota bacterium]